MKYEQQELFPQRSREPFTTLNHLFGDIAGKLRKLSDITTYCSRLVHEVMGTRSTEHFKYVDSHFVSDGVIVKYHCTIDDRDYTVKVTADPRS